MIRTKDEQLIDQAEEKTAILEDRISKLTDEIEKDRTEIKRQEEELRRKEEDIYIVAVDSGLSDKEADERVSALSDKQLKEALEQTKQCLEKKEQQLAALKRDREIFLYYLENNEEGSEC